MATLEKLESQGALARIAIRLSYPDKNRRSLYVTPRVQNWITRDLPNMVAFEETDIAPMQQARALFKMFISGEALEEGLEFRLMQPMERDVYELKSADLRFFGWFYRRGIFIVTAADTMENVHSQEGLSSRHRDGVIAERNVLDLDPPKYIEGARIADVFSV